MYTMSKILVLLQNLTKQLASHKDAIKGFIVALLTIGVDQIVEVAVFKCPCISPCSSANELCPRHKKELYSYAFIFAPSFILLMAGLTLNGKVWKDMTGCCRNRIMDFKLKCFDFLKIFGFALIAPCVWLVISFLDGDYFSCAYTSLPYEFKTNPNQTCKDLDELEFSKEYKENKQFSQAIGWILAVAFTVSAWGCYALYRCCWSDTYYQSKLNKEYRKVVEQSLSSAFVEVMENEDTTEKDANNSTTEAMFARLKQEKDEKLKKTFWRNFQYSMSHNFDATNFNLETLFEK